MNKAGAIFFLFWGTLLWFCGPVRAEEPVTVNLAADRTEIRLGESVTLSVTVTGPARGAVPRLLQTRGFSIRQMGTSSRVQISGGGMTANTGYRYQATPSKEGTFPLGPAEVTWEGSVFRSAPLQIRVADPSAGLPGTAENLFVETALTPEAGFPGQELIYRVSFFHALPVSNVMVDVPEVEGLSLRKLTDGTKYTTVANGKRYSVIEVKYAVQAQAPGDYLLPAVAFQANVHQQGQRRPSRGFFDNDFFGFGGSYRTMRILGDPTTLVIEPLPLDNRPGDFGGLVGEFSLRADLSPEEIPALESTTLTLEMSGKGNVRRFPEPEIPAIPGVKIYADQPVFNENLTSSGTVGEKLMKWALVPQESGTVEIPPISFSYFDPERKAFRTLSSGPLRLAVAPAQKSESAAPLAGGGSPGPEKTRVALLGEDIQPIHTSPEGVTRNFSSNLSTPLLSLILGLCALPFFLALAASRLARKKEGVEAQTAARKATRALEDSLRKEEADAPRVLRFLESWLVARLRLAGGSPTPAEAEERLIRAGASRERSGEFRALHEALQEAVFAGGTEEVSEAQKKELAAIAKKLDRRLP